MLMLRIVFHIQWYIIKFIFNTSITMTHSTSIVQQSGIKWYNWISRWLSSFKIWNRKLLIPKNLMPLWLLMIWLFINVSYLVINQTCV